MIDFSKKPLMLAPLAGYTDLPFRAVVKKFGADITVSEMISADALIRSNKKSIKMVEKNSNEIPYSVQIAGKNEDVIKEATLILNEVDGIDIIDLNCGCPAKKIIGNGSGSALLKDLKNMGSLISAIKKNSKKAYTSVKIRLGYDKKNHLDIAKTCQDSGADFIVVHGRLKIDFFKSGTIDYEAIREIKEALTIPVIANGDIDSFAKAKEVQNITNCDGIMIGRGSIGAPWIFYQLKNNQFEIDPKTKKDVIMEHFDRMVEFYGAHGATIFRKHAHTYSKGIRGASAFRDRVNSIDTPEEFREALISFLS